MKIVATVINNLIDDPLDPNTNKLYLHPEYLKKEVFNKITIFENSYRNEEKNLKEKNRQIEIISLLLMNIFMWLSRAYGQRLVTYVCKELVIEERNLLTSKAKKVSAYFAIFDLIDIFNYIDEEYSMIYMNEVADMVYRISDRYGAHALLVENSQFFITWKLNDPNADDNFYTKIVNRNSKETASVSFTTIVKILSKLNQMKKNYGVLEKADFEDFVHVSLHCGNFYESMVGSHLKADICFMGLDICNSHKIHQNLKKFKAAFSVTEKVFTILPECMKKHCRQIDQVKILVSEKPFGLYAVDVSNRYADISDFNFLKRRDSPVKGIEDEETESFNTGTTFSKNGFEFRDKFNSQKKDRVISFGSFVNQKSHSEKKIDFSPSQGPGLSRKFSFRSMIERLKRDRKKHQINKVSLVMKRKIHVEMKAIILKKLSKGAKNSLFLADLDIQKLFIRENEFKRSYRKGFDFYRLGAWEAAKEFFEQAIKAKLEDGYGEDGPCLYLLKYLEGFNFIKKLDWRGWRWLDDEV